MTKENTDCKTIDFTNHWNEAYIKNTTEKLGWFEKKSVQSLNLIKETKLPTNALILNVGSGSSTLIDNLLEEGYTNIIANDLSEKSLQSLKKRIKKTKNVQYLVDNLLNSKQLIKLHDIDLWNDRAVLHFFLKEEEIKAYFNLLKQILKPNGFVIIAVFAKNGAEKCCGLPLKRYDVNMLQNELGKGFKLLKSFNYTFINPYGGERPYIYTLFQRKN